MNKSLKKNGVLPYKFFIYSKLKVYALSIYICVYRNNLKTILTV